VRAEARKLRARLAKYYETEGAGDNIRFDFPKGTYAPSTIEVTEDFSGASVALGSGATVPEGLSPATDLGRSVVEPSVNDPRLTESDVFSIPPVRWLTPKRAAIGIVGLIIVAFLLGLGLRSKPGQRRTRRGSYRFIGSDSGSSRGRADIGVSVQR